MKDNSTRCACRINHQATVIRYADDHFLHSTHSGTVTGACDVSGENICCQDARKASLAGQTFDSSSLIRSASAAKSHATAPKTLNIETWTIGYARNNLWGVAQQGKAPAALLQNLIHAKTTDRKQDGREVAPESVL